MFCFSNFLAISLGRLSSMSWKSGCISFRFFCYRNLGIDLSLDRIMMITDQALKKLA